MATAIKRLSEIRDFCQGGMPLPTDLMGWLGKCLDDAMTRRAPSLEDAFGLVNDRGGVPWWLEHAIRERNAALRMLAEQHFDDKSPSQQARAIAQLARRYGASAWQIDCRYLTMPPRYANTPQEFLWRAFRSGATMPLSERQLRNIL